jgi:hypothetical protein
VLVVLDALNNFPLSFRPGRRCAAVRFDDLQLKRVGRS